jgi:hypothetical protein
MKLLILILLDKLQTRDNDLLNRLDETNTTRFVVSLRNVCLRVRVRCLYGDIVKEVKKTVK